MERGDNAELFPVVVVTPMPLQWNANSRASGMAGDIPCYCYDGMRKWPDNIARTWGGQGTLLKVSII